MAEGLGALLQWGDAAIRVMTPTDAFAAIAVIAVACDGVLDRKEAEALKHELESRYPYKGKTSLEIGELLNGLLQRLREEQWPELLSEAVLALTPAQQETALAMASHLAHANGLVDPNEEDMLKVMAFQLDLPDQRTRQILETMAILHRDSLAD